MAIRTVQERLQKFDEIIEYFAQDSRRRTAGSVTQKNLYESNGVMSASAMLYNDKNEAMIVQNYVDCAGLKHFKRFKLLPENPAAACAIVARTNKEWSMFMSFILDVIHDDDRCWDTQTLGLSQFGHLVVEAYRHLFVVDCLPDDKECVALGSKVMRANNMFDEMLKWAREFKEAHPIVNHHQEIGGNE